MQEKRKYIRLTAYHLVKYRLLAKAGEQQHEFVLASIRDIGAGGVCIRTEESLLLTGTIELKINFPSIATSIFALAKVVWVKQIKNSNFYEIGAEFIEIKESVRQGIDEHLKSVCEKVSKKKTSLFSNLLKQEGRNE
jgi:c-di-GMP-binding flagellar brake protein YcgR